MQRYHDVISSFGGKTSYDADNRPLLVMRSNLWASGYDVDGTDQTSLGQFHHHHIGRAVHQECRDRSPMPSSALNLKLVQEQKNAAQNVYTSLSQHHKTGLPPLRQFH